MNQGGGRESKRAVLVLEELQKKWRDSSSSTEGRLLGDKLAAMETKCEQLEEKLADARSEVNNSSTSVVYLKSTYYTKLLYM